MNLKDKIVLITGSGTGIGKATAFEFASKGSKVIVCYNKSEKSAKKVCDKCDGYLLQLDVSDDTSIINAYNELKGKNMIPDILVNNAGVGIFKPLTMHDFKETQKMFDVNITGLVKLTNLFLKEMKKKKSMIINVASVAGYYISKGYVPYSTTKAAVMAYTKGLGKELPSNVKAFCVNPGLTSTRMTAYLGVSVKKVSNVIINVALEKLNLESGQDVDVRKYYQIFA